MKFNTISKIASALLIAGCAALLTTTYVALQKLKVGGEIYSRIVLGKDLVADILPPPEYIIESYLETTLALNDPKSVQARRERLIVLRSEYDGRHEFWVKQNLNGSLRKSFTEGAHAHAIRFWELTEGKFLPALANADMEAARSAYTAISEAYSAHRKMIDETVKSANLLVAETEADAAHQEQLTLLVLWSVAALMFGFVTLCAIGIGKWLVTPVVRMTAAMRDLAAGNLNVRLPAGASQDEIGEMAHALVVFRDAAVEKIRLEAEAAEQRQKIEAERRVFEEQREITAAEQSEFLHTLGNALAKLSRGDLTVRLATAASDAFGSIKSDFNRMGEEVSTIVGQIALASGAVHGATTEISAGVVDLSVRTEQQAAALEETTATVEELTATVRQNSDNAQIASQSAAKARELAAGGQKVSAQAVDAMGKIEESSNRIAEIVGLIEEIAFQTNILALNAAVEAARAGEAGHGFAVVASEVRSLSQRAATALKDVKGLMVGTDTKVKEGVHLVQKAGVTLLAIVELVGQVAELVMDIAGASREQALSIEQLSTTVVQLEQMTQRNASLVEETNTALSSTHSQVDDLRSAVARFKTGIDASSDVAALRYSRKAAPAASNTAYKHQPLLSRKIAQSRKTQ